MQAIILCGGKGTRLARAIPEGLPKAMADVNGKPFLWYLLKYWYPHVSRFILATGYGESIIKSHFGQTFLSKPVHYVPCIAGTELAIEKAMSYHRKYSFIINGDTYFEPNIEELFKFHESREEKMTATFSLKGNVHAGVDIFKHCPTRRVNIFASDAYFIDIGTPESLQAFREYVTSPLYQGPR